MLGLKRSGKHVVRRIVDKHKREMAQLREAHQQMESERRELAKKLRELEQQDRELVFAQSDALRIHGHLSDIVGA